MVCKKANTNGSQLSSPHFYDFLLEQLERKGFNHHRMYPVIDKVALRIKDKVLNTALSIHHKVGNCSD
ncbi:hypothetical protein MNBD_GAMMA09-3615 [hydrothermal vent metagenome]|uniref:Uncharacterized protein n=1 Tax=hydrothermal vent metagenome TaxID=652676 RepID=A0A3B0XXB6_9ZZZZ